METVITNILGFFSQFNIQLMIPLVLFSRGLKMRKYAIWWIIFGLLPYMVTPYLVRLFGNGSFWTEDFFLLGPWYTYSFFLFAVLATILFWRILDVNIKRTLMYVLAAYTIQSFTYNLTCMMRMWITNNEPEAPYTITYYVIYLICTALVMVAFYFFIVRKYTDNQSVRFNNSMLILFSLIVVATLDVLNSWASFSGMTNIYTKIVSMILSLLILLLQFGTFEQTRLERDKEIMAQLIQEGNKKHDYNDETIQMINMKCHDMKKQIELLKDLDNEEKVKEINALEKSIDIYDKNIQTGSHILDTIIQERALIIEKYKINFSLCINGSKLDFMDPMDINALIGNALDNAIDSTKNEEESNRIISLSSVDKENLFIIKLDNFCSHKVTFRDNMPVTSKEDADNHGFGTKSMKYIVKKYNGLISLSQNKNHFLVTVIFNNENNSKINSKEEKQSVSSLSNR